MPVVAEKTTAALVRAKANAFTSSSSSGSSYKQKQSSTPLHSSNNNSRKYDFKKMKLSEALKRTRTAKSSSSTSDSSETEKLYELDTPIQNKYRVINRLGKGAYGIVWEAEDLKAREKVALKKIFDAFRNCTDAQRTYREIIFLQQFGHHPNIISLRNVHRAKNDMDIYIVFPLMVSDLHKVIKHAPKLLDNSRTRHVLYQILKALKYLHSACVVHRDLKPANILLDDYFNVKVADFGLARSILSNTKGNDTHHGPEMTDYVATRWYRPPEILLSCSNYSKGVDMWSIGCILGEMLLREALFPGNTTVEQIDYIMQTIEHPTQEEIHDLASGTNLGMLEASISAVMKKRRPLSTIFKHASYDSVNLMERLLLFHPDKRLQVENVLEHPFISRIRCISEEMTADKPVRPPLSDNFQLTTEKYQKVIYELINSQKTRIIGTMQRQLNNRNTTSTSTNNVNSQRPNYLERQREPTLTAAAVIESIKKKQRAASMQSLDTEKNASKPTRTDSAISKFPVTNSTKYPPAFGQSKEITSKSLGDLSKTGTESNGQIKVHRTQTLTKMSSSSTNSSSSKSRERERKPYNYWEERAAAKKPLVMNSNARNLPIYPAKQSSYEKTPILETLESSADFAKRRAILRTAHARVQDKPTLTRNEDYRSPFYVSNSTEESSSSLENIHQEQIGHEDPVIVPEVSNSHQEERHDEYRNSHSRSRESVSVADKRSILNEAKARTRAATSVPWLTSQLEIQKGQGDFGVLQRRHHEEPSKLFSTPYGDREIWSRSYTPGPTASRKEQGYTNDFSRSQKTSPYQHQSSNTQKHYWPSQTRHKQVPGIELMNDENPRIRQSTYFPSRSPSAGGDFRGYRHSSQTIPSKPDYNTTTSYSNHRPAQFPFLNPKASSSNHHGLHYRSPYEAKILRPETRTRGHGSKNSDKPMRPWEYK